MELYNGSDGTEQLWDKQTNCWKSPLAEPLASLRELQRLVADKLKQGGRHTMPPPRAVADWAVACWRRDKLCGDLNSQRKRPGDLDF